MAPGLSVAFPVPALGRGAPLRVQLPAKPSEKKAESKWANEQPFMHDPYAPAGGRQWWQAAPLAARPPAAAVFVHCPYAVCPCEEPLNFHTYESAADLLRKNQILCLAHVAGRCTLRYAKDEAGKSTTSVVPCPYAHPDLREVPDGVCATWWFTGFCRFHRRSEAQAVGDNEGCTAKAPAKRRRGGRKPAICPDHHDAAPAGERVLLPGLSRKMTPEERETALALYPHPRC